MNRTAFIAKLTEVQQTVEQLLANFRCSQKTRREPQSHSLSSHPTPEASATALFR